MADLILQGEISLTGLTVEPGRNTFGYRIQTLRINNTASAYTFKLERYQKSTNDLTTIYELSLDAGDIVTDTYPYYLEVGDYLVLSTNVAGTNYLISGVQ